jgi:hypothetical protein
MSSTVDQVSDLVRRWVAAEIAGDAAELDPLATADFRLVGPAGFVLDKQQWLGRYHPGALVTTSLSVSDLDTRACGETVAISIGVQNQQATYQGHPADGRFRVTVIAARDDPGATRWRLAGVHLSPIAAPRGGAGGS